MVTSRIKGVTIFSRKLARLRDMGGRGIYPGILLLSLGHLVTDINQGALPALLPFFLAEYGLSFAAAASLVFASNALSTLVQPLFGHLADRLATPWLLPLGIVLAGTGLATTGLASSYHAILAAVMVSGIGVAAFHPQGAWLVNRLAPREATAMSVFGVGGSLGFAIGPALTTWALLQWGLPGSLVLAAPALSIAALLAWWLRRVPLGPPGLVSHGRCAPRGRDAWGPFMGLTVVVIIRSVLGYGFSTFVPLYWIYVLHQSKASGAIALTTFTLVGVLGTLCGGRLADRFGRIRVVVGASVLLLPLIPAFLAAPSVPLALSALVAIGFIHAGSYSPLIVLAQEYIPNHLGFSSGVTLGIAVTAGGVATPLLGQIADWYGLGATFGVLAILPLVSAGISATLPEGRLPGPPMRRGASS